jgi:hypothetical protein
MPPSYSRAFLSPASAVPGAAAPREERFRPLGLERCQRFDRTRRALMPSRSRGYRCLGGDAELLSPALEGIGLVGCA